MVRAGSELKLRDKPKEVEMKDNEDAFNQEQDGANATESTTLGIDPLEANADLANEQKANVNEEDPYGVKKRLGMQAKKHAREMRQMQEQLAQVQQALTNPNQTGFHQEPQNPFNSPGQPSNPGMNQEEMMRQAMAYALQATKHEEMMAKQNAANQHVAKQYDKLKDDLAKGDDKYDDFDEVVRGDTPYTSHIRDALLLVDNPDDVAYKLGKNPAELSRISQLHPLDQAREVNRLSFALMGGNKGKGANSIPTPMGNPRPNPTNTGASNASASSIRARMKAGTFK